MKNGFFDLRSAADEVLGDLAGHVGRVVLRLLRAPVVVRARARRPRCSLREHARRGRRGCGVTSMFANSTSLRAKSASPQVLQLAVPVHHEVEVVVGGDVEQPAPDVEALRDLAVGVARAVAVQPLADQRRAVAGLLEPGREDVAAVLHPVPAVRVEVAADAVVVGVLAGDEGRPRRAAERERVDRVGERRALRRRAAADVRHLRDVGARLVVGHHDEDVRAAVLAGAGRARLGGGRRRAARGRRAPRATACAPCASQRCSRLVPACRRPYTACHTVSTSC